jgi:hypothetical protein
MRGSVSAAALAVLVVSSSFALAAGAPSQLYNKTITISWTSSGTAKGADGRVINFSNTNTRTIYVSTAGRLFVRFNLNSNRRHSTGRSGEAGPTDKVNADGNARDIHFEGNRLVGTAAFNSGGARQFVATFDSGFSSCTASVVAGKSGSGPMTMKGPDGAMYSVDRMESTGATCSIQSGNAFAN